VQLTIVNGEAIDAAGVLPGKTEQDSSLAYAQASGWVDDPPARATAQVSGIAEVAAAAAAHPPAVTAPNRISGSPATGPVLSPRVAHEAELRHGYTLAHLDALAVQAARGQRFSRDADFAVRLEDAWSAIAESLYAADERPTPDDLVRAAWTAMSGEADRISRAHGLNTHDRYAGTIGRFQQYWIGSAHQTRSPEEPIVERVALSQIWSRLSLSHRQLLLALAVHDDHGRAADALDKPRTSFSSQLAQARRAFLTLWHDGERPSRPWGTDRRVSAGSTDRHSRTYVIRVRERGRQAHVAAHGEPPAPRVRKGKPPADLGITVQELARRYEQVKSIRVLAAALGVSYGALQRRMQAEGIGRPAALSDEVRQRKRRRARATAIVPDDPGKVGSLSGTNMVPDPSIRRDSPPTLIITRGLPAAGKTTRALRWVAEDPQRRARVGSDEIAAMLHPHVVADAGYGPLLQSAPERVTPNTVPARSDAAQSQRRRPSRPAAPEGTCR
jgi:hypothetical protein